MRSPATLKDLLLEEICILVWPEPLGHVTEKSDECTRRYDLRSISKGRHEAYVPAEHEEARQAARLSPPHVHPCGPDNHQGSSQAG